MKFSKNVCSMQISERLYKKLLILLVSMIVNETH
jgi:hypothetical protein